MNPTSSLDPSIQAAIGAMESTMQQFFHHLPNPFQRLIIPKILQMMKKRLQPRPILLVQGTGGGKSAVPQTTIIIIIIIVIIVIIVTTETTSKTTSETTSETTTKTTTKTTTTTATTTTAT